MNKVTVCLCLTLIAFLGHYSAHAYDDKTTHKHVTDVSVDLSILDKFLQTSLGIDEGLKKKYKVDGKQNTILLLLKSGSEHEDLAMRAKNHFWNPLRNEGMDDTINFFKGLGNRDWAVGQTDGGKSLDECSGGDHSEDNECNDYSWRKARDAYFKALTSTSDSERDQNYAKLYEKLGRVLHLLQDTGVPAHTRNDMLGHLDYTKIKGINPKNWGGNLYEYWAQENLSSPDVIKSRYTNIITPTFSSYKDFWDKEVYNWNTNPEVTIASGGKEQAGLAEYTSSNFLSRRVMFTNTLPNTDKHYFPYPRKECLKEIPQETIAEDGKKDTTFYVEKDKDGEAVKLFALKKYVWRYIENKDQDGTKGYYRLKYKLDENVHSAYASKLIPKVVGYSTGIVNYFFRGTVTPKNIITVSNNPGEISQVNFDITNSSMLADQPEVMKGGSVSMGYRYVPAGSSEAKYGLVKDVYVFSGENDTINSDFVSKTALLTNPIPLPVSDIAFTFIYKGKLGNEEDAIAAKVVKPTFKIGYTNTPGGWPNISYIYTARPDGTGYWMLNDTDGYVWREFVTWSLDGSKMAFTGTPASGRARIVVVDLTSKNPYPANAGTLGDDDNDYLDPSFSPDGKKIAAQKRVFNYPADSDHQVYPVQFDLETGQPSIIVSREFWEEKPYVRHLRWSPVGEKIAHESLRLVNLGGYSWYEMYNVRMLTPSLEEDLLLTDPECDSRYPSWSPDGRQIVFTSNLGTGDIFGPMSLWIMDQDGRNMQRIRECQTDCIRPSFTPDGKRIVFAIFGQGIHAIKPDGTGFEKLLNTPAGSNPMCSPFLFEGDES